MTKISGSGGLGAYEYEVTSGDGFAVGTDSAITLTEASSKTPPPPTREPPA